MLASKISRHGVKVLSYQESWTEAPGELGELLFAIAGWVARMESQRRSERTKAGLERARLKGKKLGRQVKSLMFMPILLGGGLIRELLRLIALVAGVTVDLKLKI